MNKWKRIIITVFGLGLAVIIFIELQVLYNTELPPMLIGGSEIGTIRLGQVGLMVARIIGHGLWMLLVGIVAFVWATPIRRIPKE